MEKDVSWYYLTKTEILNIKDYAARERAIKRREEAELKIIEPLKFFLLGHKFKNSQDEMTSEEMINELYGLFAIKYKKEKGAIDDMLINYNNSKEQSKKR